MNHLSSKSFTTSHAIRAEFSTCSNKLEVQLYITAYCFVNTSLIICSLTFLRGSSLFVNINCCSIIQNDLICEISLGFALASVQCSTTVSWMIQITVYMPVFYFTLNITLHWLRRWHFPFNWQTPGDDISCLIDRLRNCTLRSCYNCSNWAILGGLLIWLSLKSVWVRTLKDT